MEVERRVVEEKLSQRELEQWLWNEADITRGAVRPEGHGGYDLQRPHRLFSWSMPCLAKGFHLTQDAAQQMFRHFHWSTLCRAYESIPPGAPLLVCDRSKMCDLD